MKIKNFPIALQKQTTRMQKFVLFIFVVATLNLVQMQLNYHSGDFHYGPPINFLPRLLVFAFLMIASISSFIEESKWKLVSSLCLASAFLVYIHWWISSYQGFKQAANFGVNIFNSAEIDQVAYLYMGNWIDIVLVIIIFVALLLQLEILLNKKV